ncbi:hypothetical protein F4560_004326 [Saccharothrix ecbatanensis]|uniref:LSDAT prokaryote domain-containing protein n=1 Tax=Saccharothrix ecbatanensis TaxID=1105145 RepID=A0A7W9HLK9_9PSEU|nr:hypothetical protein [Saccharothrix ecbatanensis]MBB5804558.1 hypothetical protein [Saccharothrix ecbatanensis]
MPTAGTGPRVRRLAHPDADIKARALGLPRGRPVLAVFGSADSLDTELAATVLPVLRAVLAAAAREGAVVITAGADVGVTHLLGLAAESLDGNWPRLVGVAPSGRVAAEDAEPAEGEVRLNVNHDTAVLVPGSRWGEETPALFRTVDAVVGSKRPALALLIGGDDLSRAALVDHLGRDRPLLVLAGTGALADEIAGGRLDQPGEGIKATGANGANGANGPAEATGPNEAKAADLDPMAGPVAAVTAALTPDASIAPDAPVAPGAAVSDSPAFAAPLPAGAGGRTGAGAAGGGEGAGAGGGAGPRGGGGGQAGAEPGGGVQNDDLAVLVRSGQVAVVHLDEGADKVVAVLRRVLGNRPGAKLHADVPPPAVWPRVRFRAPDPRPVVDPGYVLDYPLLADAIHEANQAVAPALHECEVAALRSKERARLLVVLAIAAGFGTTLSAALQVWLRDEPWPGVLLAVSGAAAAVLTVMARGGEDPDARVRAEQLRALYFDHLAAPPAADDAEREERSRELATSVARLRHESVSRT